MSENEKVRERFKPKKENTSMNTNSLRGNQHGNSMGKGG